MSENLFPIYTDKLLKNGESEKVVDFRFRMVPEFTIQYCNNKVIQLLNIHLSSL